MIRSEEAEPGAKKKEWKEDEKEGFDGFPLFFGGSLSILYTISA